MTAYENQSFDLKALLERTSFTVASTEEALSDVVPIEWEKEVVDGKKQVLVSGKK